ncbi:unnamed protein product [Urochloa decumbens]|uniref:F-box domain-containing protein n=1 Tax=Urochloa decumbens TaxID=240449 RepID=A0ABC9DRX9_9POAL
MAADRLSALPDRLLQRVVSHLCVGDAARTSLLSRRWRTIWLQADGVNLDSSSYDDDGDYDGGNAGKNDFLEDIMRVSPGMDAVLAAPATRRLEELHMELSAEFCQTCDEYVLPASLLLLPCQPSLRVLDLDGLTLGPPCAAADFGRLEPREPWRRVDFTKARLGLEKSMESLERHKSEKIASPSSGVEDGDGRGDDDLDALKARSFPCLESHLKKIRLEFELKSFDCFEVRLAKFLVENALVLEEMEVHDGNQRVSDHIHRKLPIWRANSLKSKIKIVGEYK